MEQYLINEGSKNLIFEVPSPRNKIIQISNQELLKLINLSKVNILILTAESSYHAPYDHGTSNFLKQAGVDHDFIRLEDHGMKGNGHMMMHEKNSREISKFINNWIGKHYV